MLPVDPSRPHRTRILLLCAAVILLFTFADVAAIGHFSWAAFSARVVWAALTAGAALYLPRAKPASQQLILYALGIWTSAFFALLTFLTGGSSSPLFHWILAMPVLVAVVVQDAPGVTVAAGVTTIISGLLLLIQGKAPVDYAVPWVVQAAAMSALAWYASSTYEQLRARELEALKKANAFDSEAARRKKAEEEVRSRDDFLAVASHELKTPLTSLNLQIQSLRASQSTSDETTKQKLEIIERQVRRLSGLLGELFDLSRLRQRQLDLNFSSVDVCEVSREVVGRMQPVAAQFDSQIHVELCGSLVGWWDRTRLEQVLTNLLSNAIKYGAGKPIYLHVSHDNGTAVIAVRDEGIGIAKEDQARIFQRFERAVSANNYGGLGLGLWISKEIVEGFGGSIFVESSPGKGATFIVRLPVTQPPKELAH